MPALSFHAPLLRAIAEALHLPPVTKLAKGAGVRAIYRVTISYYDGRACNSVATLIAGIGAPRLEVAYQKALGENPLIKIIDADAFTHLEKALLHAKFDHMPDQPNLPDYNSVDLWMIERAAGTFTRSVIVAPASAADYAQAAIIAAVRDYLPEALREIS